MQKLCRRLRFDWQLPLDCSFGRHHSFIFHREISYGKSLGRWAPREITFGDGLLSWGKDLSIWLIDTWIIIPSVIQICIYASSCELGCLNSRRIQLWVVDHVKRVLDCVNFHGLVAKRNSLAHYVSIIAQKMLAGDKSWVELSFKVDTFVVTAALHTLPSIDLGMTYAEDLVFSDGCGVSDVVEQRL